MCIPFCLNLHSKHRIKENGFIEKNLGTYEKHMVKQRIVTVNFKYYNGTAPLSANELLTPSPNSSNIRSEIFKKE